MLMTYKSFVRGARRKPEMFITIPEAVFLPLDIPVMKQPRKIAEVISFPVVVCSVRDKRIGAGKDHPVQLFGIELLVYPAEDFLEVFLFFRVQPPDRAEDTPVFTGYGNSRSRKGPFTGLWVY